MDADEPSVFDRLAVRLGPLIPSERLDQVLGQLRCTFEGCGEMPSQDEVVQFLREVGIKVEIGFRF